jgi:hypothetical protein
MVDYAKIERKWQKAWADAKLPEGLRTVMLLQRKQQQYQVAE